MRRNLFILAFMLASMLAFSQTDSASYFLQKGLQEKQKGRLMESYKNFSKAISYDGNNKQIVNEYATACLNLRKYNEARETYKKLVALGDETAANYKELMTLSFNLKQNDDVILYANKLKEIDPSEKVNYYIAKVNYDDDNYGDAIKYLNLAAKEDPQNGEIPYMIAHCYADMMNYKQAIPYFQKAIGLDTSKNYWIYEMGLIYYAMNDDKNALKYILLAGDKGYKKDNDYMENLGIAYLNVGDLNNGIGIINDLLQKRPSDINLLDMVAEAFYYKGKYQEAMDYWDKILGYDKTNASALYMIGMCYQKKGDKDKGIQLCDKAIEMDPSLSSYRQKKMMAGL
ncbi:MAG TPA: tetratricopeptide repeat protein [Chitinophagaceae bacterium]|nr:tetratricopeptide repeat protein [Chitinophagaceae bacterium]